MDKIAAIPKGSLNKLLAGVAAAGGIGGVGFGGYAFGKKKGVRSGATQMADELGKQFTVANVKENRRIAESFKAHNVKENEQIAQFFLRKGYAMKHGAMPKMAGAIDETYQAALYEEMEKIGGPFPQMLKGGYSAAKGAVGNVAKASRKPLSDIMQNPVAQSVKQFGQGVKEGTRQAYRRAEPTLKDAYGRVKGAVGEPTAQVRADLAAGYKTVKGQTSQTFNQANKNIRKEMGKATKKAEEFVGQGGPQAMGAKVVSDIGANLYSGAIDSLTGFVRAAPKAGGQAVKEFVTGAVGGATKPSGFGALVSQYKLPLGIGGGVVGGMGVNSMMNKRAYDEVKNEAMFDELEKLGVTFGGVKGVAKEYFQGLSKHLKGAYKTVKHNKEIGEGIFNKKVTEEVAKNLRPIKGTLGIGVGAIGGAAVAKAT